MKLKLFLLLTTLSVLLKVTYSQSESMVFKHSFGKFEIILLSESQQQGKSSVLLGANQEMLRQYVPDSTYPTAMNAFLLLTPQKKILIDAGLGISIFSHLQDLGVENEDIDVILLTHMHGDHIGGLLKEGKVMFPNAELYIENKEYHYWVSEEEMRKHPKERQSSFVNAQRVISAYKNRLHLFDAGHYDHEKKELFPGIYSIAAYGHTPGHTLYLLSSEGNQLLVWGDLVHAMVLQMPFPQVAVTYDTDPEKAVKSRQEILNYVTRSGIPVAGMHIPFPAMGHVEKGQPTGCRFIPLKSE